MIHACHPQAGSQSAVIRAFQICNGLGAGNIGDELMARAFWETLPSDIQLDVPLFPEALRHREAYPEPHRYIPVNLTGGHENESAAVPGLLIGDTPVTENEGLDWPLRFLAPRLHHFHSHSLPVDAAGVGVDRLSSPEARALFREAFAPIRSWTVRSARCRDSLLDLGIHPDKVIVGADWAWLYTPRLQLEQWATETWMQLDVDPSRRPLLVANVANMQWSDIQVRRNIASAFDRLSQLGFRIAFFCNESRAGKFFDVGAAHEIADMMDEASVIVPPRYYSADEAIALLRPAAVTVAQRYHFAVQSVLAGVPPVCILRGQKMDGLADELGLAVAGTVKTVAADALTDSIQNVMEHRSHLSGQLAAEAARMSERASQNLSFIRRMQPYDAAFTTVQPLEPGKAWSRRNTKKTIPENATVLILQVGGLGDLVLTSELVTALTQARPDIRIVFMCRGDFAGVVDLFPVRPAEVVPLTFNPYASNQPVEEMYAELAPLVNDLRARRPDVFIAASLNPTWFSWFVNAAVQPVLSVCCTQFTPPPEPLTTALRRFGLVTRELTNLDVPTGHELERYRHILRHFSVNVPASTSAWELPSAIVAAAQKFLSDQGLEHGNYLVCFPSGSAGTVVKRWPEERFVEVLNAIQGETGLPVLLVGDKAETERLARIGTSLQPVARTFCGDSGDLPLLAGLLAGAAAYLGNDTGPMHLASAYGVRGVVIYGGGHWPAYAPWSEGTVGLVHPLPCFNCDWDCVFGRGLCVTSIESGVVLDALRKAINQEAGPPRVETVASLAPEVHGIVRDAARRYQEASDQARFREEKLVQLTSMVAERDLHFVEIETAANERLAAIHELTRIVEDRTRQLEDRGRQLKDIQRLLALPEREDALDVTLEAISVMKETLAQNERHIQELDKAARERLANIEQLTNIIREREQYTAEVERAAVERLTALETTNAERRRLEDVSSAQEQRIVALTQDVEQLKGEMQMMKNETVIHFLVRRYKVLFSTHS